jgi:hypothetical protein
LHLSYFTLFPESHGTPYPLPFARYLLGTSQGPAVKAEQSEPKGTLDRRAARALIFRSEGERVGQSELFLLFLLFFEKTP